MVNEATHRRARALVAPAALARPALLAALLALWLAACQPPESRSAATGEGSVAGATIAMRTVGELSSSGFVVEVTATRAGAPLAGAEVTIVGEMTHPGMPRLTWPAPEVEPGLYRLEHLQPDMPGDWIITAELVPEAGGKVTAELFLSVPR